MQEVAEHVDISIHALRKESDKVSNHRSIITSISIHALRKESDFRNPHQIEPELISIHALRKESDRRVPYARRHSSDFNPRSP